MRDLIVMKIGGSVCTDKSRGKFMVRERTVRRIAAEIADARKKKNFRLLVVNGAGPYGHVNVAEYGINEGLKTGRDYDGFAKTVCDCDYVNYRVADILRRQGLLAYPYPSSSAIMQADKRIVHFALDPVKRLWMSNEDIIPVMNGTMVPDFSLGGTVVSGDAVIEYVSNRLKPSLIIFATDVDGIFTLDPNRFSGAKIIEEISKESFDGIKHGISGSSNTDVTGGMLGKVERLLGLGIRTLIINGNAPGRVMEALVGDSVKSTVINP